MEIKIDSGSGVPIYLQIEKQVKFLAVCGALQPGDRLPSVRELAVGLRVNPNTVARSYRHLQDEALIVSRWGGGNFIADDITQLTRQEARSIITEQLTETIHQAEALGIGPVELKKILTNLLKVKGGRK